MKVYSLSFNPTEDGYIIQSNGFKYTLSSGTNFMGEYDGMNEVLNVVKDDMSKNNFYPDIFFVSDHGNIWQIDEEGEEIKILEENIDDGSIV